VCRLNILKHNNNSKEGKYHLLSAAIALSANAAHSTKVIKHRLKCLNREYFIQNEMRIVQILVTVQKQQAHHLLAIRIGAHFQQVLK
jgi:hypothetical protein